VGDRVTDATLLEVREALAAQIAGRLANLDSSYGELQVLPRRLFSPTPPTIDIYPADPVQEQTAFGYESRDTFLTVRARVTMADDDAGQDLLWEFADTTTAASLLAAFAADPTLGGTADNSTVEEQTGFRIYEDTPGSGGYLGCEWRLRIVR
jgi:hypothetical protein